MYINQLLDSTFKQSTEAEIAFALALAEDELQIAEYNVRTTRKVHNEAIRRRNEVRTFIDYLQCRRGTQSHKA